MTDRLIAVANGRLVGEIGRDAGGRLRFEYERAGPLGPEIPGVSRSAFSLLTATGEDCPGAVQFVRPERAGQLLTPQAGALPYPGRYAPRLKLAMKIGGESRIGYVRVRHWERFAAEVGLPADEVLGICESVAAETPGRLRRIVADSRAEGMDHPVVARLEEAVTEQAKACLAGVRQRRAD